MENGEKAVLALQFGLLLVIVLIMGNLFPGQATQPPTFKGVYWGQAISGNEISQAGVLHAKTNATAILAFFQLPPTAISSVTAGRTCSDPATRNGESRTYGVVIFRYDLNSSSSYFLISPVSQQNGWSCTYGLQIKDTLGGTANWSGTVVVGQ